MAGDNARVGIEISVSAGELQTLIKRLQQTDKEARNAGSGTKTFAGSVKAAGESFLQGAAHATRLHHALRIMHHLTRIASEVFGRFRDSLAKSLEFRFNDDSIKRSVTFIERAMTRFNNASLDKFAPLLVGISTVLTALSKDFEKASVAGRKMAAKEVIDWFTKLGPLIVDAVVVAVELFARAVLGVRIAWNGLKVLVDLFFEKNIAYLAKWVDGLAQVATAIKPDSALAKGLTQASEAVYGLAKQFESSGDVAKAAILKDAKTLDELDAKTESVGKTVKKAIADAAAIAMKNLDAHTHHAVVSAEELEARARRLLALDWEAFLNRMKKASEQFARQADLIEKSAKLQQELDDLLVFDKAAEDIEHMNVAWAKFNTLVQQGMGSIETEKLRKKLQEASKSAVTEDIQQQLESKTIPGLLRAWETYYQNKDKLLLKDQVKMQRDLEKETRAVASTIASGLVDSFASIIKGTETVQQAFAGMLENMAKRAIAFLAEEAIIALIKLFVTMSGGGEAGASGGSGPGFGANLIGKLFGFASGGPVYGGVPGRDSVPALLTPGEYVLPVDMVKRIKGGAGPSMHGRYASGGSVSAGSASTGGSVTHNHIRPDVHVWGTASQAQLDRLVRDTVDKSISRMRRFNYQAT